MRIYNTLTKRKEEFVPLEPGKVRIYECGPTVYDYLHIGNARPNIVFDTVRRYLEYKGYEVITVRNYTDVDDKIIKRAIKEGVPPSDIADRFIAEAVTDVKGLNVKDATYAPRVTQEIPEIIEMIKELIEKGYAYEVKGSVFYDTGKFPEYGKLSHKNIEELEAGARIEIDEDKKSPMDFVLWKPAKPGEPYWESPWGNGRPGWHIECSVMSRKYLGNTIDIHGGGEDLIFPHHENEIAQSEAVSGRPFVKYWMHVRFLYFDNQKMSKSKGNFYTTREISKRFPYPVIRFLFLSVGYRSPINFSDELLTSAENGLNRIKNAVFNISFLLPSLSGAPLSQEEKQTLSEADVFMEDFTNSMDDDFNTADAVTAIFELVRLANVHVSDRSSKVFAEQMQNRITALCDVLGIVLGQPKAAIGIDENEIESLIQERQNARQNKDYKAADQIRLSLAEKGIILEDTPSGVRWSYKG